MTSKSSNQMEVPEAKAAMDRFKTEVASELGVNLKDGYVRVRDGEAYLVNVHISPYEQGNLFNHDPLRTRKLLMHLEKTKRFMKTTVLCLTIFLSTTFQI